MAPTHIVSFEWKEDTPAETIKQLSEEAMALKHNCVKPETGEPYIKSLTGGKGFTKDVWEGTQSGQQIIANLEFANEEDERFYVTQDQVHIAFVQKVSPYIAKANVLRFEPGVL